MAKCDACPGLSYCWVQFSSCVNPGTPAAVEKTLPWERVGRGQCSPAYRGSQLPRLICQVLWLCQGKGTWKCWATEMRPLHPKISTKQAAVARFGKLIANRNQRASVPTSSCSGACFDTQLLSQNMPWEGRSSIAVTLLPASTLRYTLPCEQRGAAATLLWRVWNPCLRNKHHAHWSGVFPIHLTTAAWFLLVLAGARHWCSQVLQCAHSAAPTVLTWCSSCKRPDGVGQGSQETAVADWLSSSSGSLLPTVVWPLLIPAQQPLQNPSSSWHCWAWKCVQQGEKQVWGWGEVLSQDVKEIWKAYLGGICWVSKGFWCIQSLVSLTFWLLCKSSLAFSKFLCPVLTEKLPYLNNLQWKEVREKRSSEGRMFSSFYSSSIPSSFSSI